MKVRTGLLMVVVASGMLCAESAPNTTPANGKAQAQPAAQSQPAAKPAWKPAGAAPAASTKPAAAPAKSSTTATPAKSAAASGATAKKKSTKKAAAAPAGNVAKNVASQPKHTVASNRRDPFVSPIQSHNNGPINCGTGKRCLVVDQTILEGIVKAPNGMIAVVSNSANKAYFLRENDPVYNGFVMRITPDSVVFREQVTDKLGNKSTREVVKRVNAPAV